MRPTTIVTLVTGIVIALFIGGLSAYIYFNHSGGKLWFYWLAPLLTIGVALCLINIGIQYYRSIGRVESKGRPRAQ